MNEAKRMAGFPGDKSISHRALLIASLAQRPIRLDGINLGGAVTPLIQGLEQLGVCFSKGDNWLDVTGPKSLRSVPGEVLHMGPSSAAARLLTGLLAGLGVSAVIDGDAVLRRRPMDWVVEPLNAMGARICYLGRDGRLPVKIESADFQGGRSSMQVVSAQAVSAVLLAGFAAGRRVEIKTIARSRDHTERVIEALGGKIEERNGLLVATPCGAGRQAARHLPDHWMIPGDPSAVAYTAAAQVLSEGSGDTTFTDVCLNPTRLGFFDFLQACGAHVELEATETVVGEPVGAITVSPAKNSLRPVTWMGKSRIHTMIDEVPLAVAVAAFATGPSRFGDCEELSFKETNRLETTRDLLSAFGLFPNTTVDSIVVPGGAAASKDRISLTVPSFGDHRIAMTAAVLACALERRTTVYGGLCCETSFPNFPELMQRFGFPITACNPHLEIG